MDDFASFSKKQDERQTTDPDWQKEAEKIAASCRGKSEGDVMREIYLRAAEGKRNGTLTNDQIDAFYRQFAPMLDAPKRKRLQKLVKELKEM